MGVLRKSWRRGIALALGLTGFAALGIKAYHDTMEPPLVRETQVALPGLTAPMRVLLMSDIHVSGPDMPPERLARIVEGLNRLHPDMVLITGDFLSDKLISTRHYANDPAVAPLRGLRSRWGTVAVLGNHDTYRGAPAIKAALERLGIRVLIDQATRVGPLTVGGYADLSTHYAHHDDTFTQMHHLGPPYVFIAHEPDPFENMPRDIPLMLAGHTHCGQISLPLIGPLATGTGHPNYVCGVVKEHGDTLIVTAGLGTSDLPFRFGAHGDVWLVTLTPAPLKPENPKP